MMSATSNNLSFCLRCVPPITFSTNESLAEVWAAFSDSLSDDRAGRWVEPLLSQTHVGRQQIYLPYFYYQAPRETYPGSRPFGHW